MLSVYCVKCREGEVKRRQEIEKNTVFFLVDLSRHVLSCIHLLCTQIIFFVEIALQRRDIGKKGEGKMKLLLRYISVSFRGFRLANYPK